MVDLIPVQFKEESIPIDFPDDVERIQKAFAENGYSISKSDAVRAWEEYSDRSAAGWLIMNDYVNDIIFSLLKKYFEIGD